MLETSLGVKKLHDVSLLRQELTWIQNAGFETGDLAFDPTDVCEMLWAPDCDKRMAEAQALINDMGFHFYQGHAPFPPSVDGNPEQTARNRAAMLKSIRYAGQLGVQYMTVHPITANTRNPLYMRHDILLQQNIDMYKQMVEEGNKYNVKICTENLFTRTPDADIVPTFSSDPQNLLDLMDAVPGLYVTLDFGHAVLTGHNPADMARAFGKRLGSLHLHGNNAKDDLHISPFEHTHLPWEDFFVALHEIDYQGAINLEVGKFCLHQPDALKPAAYAYLHACAAYIAGQVKG